MRSPTNRICILMPCWAASSSWAISNATSLRHCVHLFVVFLAASKLQAAIIAFFLFKSTTDFSVYVPHLALNDLFACGKGLGRTATLACILGLILGTNFTLIVLLGMHSFGLGTISLLDGVDPGRILLLQQWLAYVVLLSIFHIAEFFVTAIWNPSVTSADSFVVNQSLAYTGAALVSWVEFWARFAFFPSANSTFLSGIGLGLVLMGQACRTLAMVTCGQSFNHLIQIAKKSNHDLVTQGM
mmetsp:Transcript_12193/g.35718  ORF Transcript_12193/g.35718 Transcript_12193/m.35718 type:complete len:242 (-) Transcript_12193:534-1259(-)